jgi:xanthine dehydrogenase YagR molybdenum-binding subunit
MNFEEFGEFIGSQEGAAPKAVAPGTPSPSAIIGAAIPRIDGPLKTTGMARYASDYNFPGLVYAVPVRSTIASGKILSIDSSKAERMPGVLLVMQHDKIMPLRWTQQRKPASV